MKFTCGYWMKRPEVVCTDTVQMREIRNEGDRICIYAVPYSQDSRALGGPVIEIFISSPRPGIFRVQARHFAGSRLKIPGFELNEEPVSLITEDCGDSYAVRSGDARIEIQKNPARISFFYKDRLLTSVSNSFRRRSILRFSRRFALSYG